MDAVLKSSCHLNMPANLAAVPFPSLICLMYQLGKSSSFLLSVMQMLNNEVCNKSFVFKHKIRLPTLVVESAKKMKLLLVSLPLIVLGISFQKPSTHFIIHGFPGVVFPAIDTVTKNRIISGCDGILEQQLGHHLEPVWRELS